MTAPIRYTKFPSPACRRVRLGRWTWAVTDGLGGPVLTGGTTRTERGAHRRIGQALSCCERQERPAPETPVLHPLSPVEAEAIKERLAADGIPVTIRVGDWVHLYPAGPVDTEGEVRALAAVKAVTDARVDWHRAVAR